MMRDHIRDTPFRSQYEPFAHEDVGVFAHIRESLDESADENMVDSVTTPLVLRPKITQPVVVTYTKGKAPKYSPSMESEVSEENSHSESESTDDEHGFTMVSRPKPSVPDIPDDEPMSSPDLVSTPVIDILKATGSDYSDDDEWTML
jgi:hypothetical protein